MGDETQLLEEKMRKYYDSTFKKFKRVVDDLNQILQYAIIIVVGIFALFFAGGIFQLLIALNENIK
jgi:type II secretory pathway component PulF